MKKVVWSIFIITASFFGYAQNDTAVVAKPFSELSLEELLNTEVISATKKLQKQNEAPSIISIIPLNQFKAIGAVTLIDALKFIPSLEVSMGVDGFYRVSIRGTRKEGNILLMIDGNSLNDFYTGKALFDLPIDFIDRVEIIRGPGSSIYGSNAMVGVINIISIKRNNISIGGGINNTLKLGANFFKQKNKNNISFSVGGQTSKGAHAVIDTDKVGSFDWSLTNLDKSFTTNRWNKDAYFNTNINIGDLHINLFDAVRQQGMYAGPLFIATTNSKLLTNQFAGSVAYDYKISDNVIITPKLYGNINYADYLIQETPENYKSVISKNIFENGKQTKQKYIGKTYGFATDIVIKASENFDILTGTVFEDSQLTNYNLKRNYKILGEVKQSTFGNYDDIMFDQNDKRRLVFAYFMQGTYKYKNLNITAGVRYDDYNDFGSSFNPRVGITYKVNKTYNIKGLYGKAFRAPTFNELYDNTTLGSEYGVKGNRTLKPETINTFELANEFDLDMLLLKYNVFYIKNDNLIRIYDPFGGGSVGNYNNIGNLVTYGHEFEFDVMLNKVLHISGNYSHYLSTFNWNKETVLKSDLAFYEKQPAYFKTLTNSPSMRLNLGVLLHAKKFKIFVGGNYGNQSFNNNRFYLEQDHYAHIPQYIQGNANISYQVTKKFTVNIVATNIGKKFSDPDESTNIDAFGKRGLIQPSASVLLNLNYNF